MKKLLFILCMLVTITAYTQNERPYNRFSIEPSVGITKIQDITPFEFANFNLGFRYMLNPKFGVRVSGTHTDNIETYWSADIQGVINVGRALEFEEFTKNYTILFGLGGNYTHLNKEPESNIFHLNSNYHVTASLDNLYRLNNNVALKASLNFVKDVNNKQQTGNDASTTNTFGINLGIAVNLSKKEHADWYVPAPILPSNVTIDKTVTIHETPITKVYVNECNCSENEYVFFDNDKSVIKSTGLNAITKIVNYLIINPEAEVYLTGYSSNTPNTSEGYDKILAENRNTVVANKLYELGISYDRINITVIGKDYEKKSSSFDYARRVRLMTKG